MRRMCSTASGMGVHASQRPGKEQADYSEHGKTRPNRCIFGRPRTTAPHVKMTLAQPVSVPFPHPPGKEPLTLAPARSAQRRDCVTGLRDATMLRDRWWPPPVTGKGDRWKNADGG